MTNKEIVDWLDQFHNNLEDYTDKTHLNVKDLLELMPEEIGRAYLGMLNEAAGKSGKEYSYDYIMSDEFPYPIEKNERRLH